MRSIIVVDHAGLLALTDGGWELGGRELTDEEMAEKRERSMRVEPLPEECVTGRCEHGCLPF